MTIFIERFFDKSFPGLVKALDMTWRRNEAIVSNIANADTPGYRAVDVNFSNELKQAFNRSGKAVELHNTDPKHLNLSELSGAHLVADYTGVTKADGNNVDIDMQMARLNYNSGKYSNAATLIRSQMMALKTAIREARS